MFFPIVVILYSCHPERSEGSVCIHVYVSRFFVASLLRMTQKGDDNGGGVD